LNALVHCSHRQQRHSNDEQSAIGLHLNAPAEVPDNGIPVRYVTRDLDKGSRLQTDTGLAVRQRQLEDAVVAPLDAVTAAQQASVGPLLPGAGDGQHHDLATGAPGGQ
jgi:hypothetical protein